MNIETKFRAYDKTHKKIFGENKIFDVIGINFKTKVVLLDAVELGDIKRCFHEIELMQFTGKTDKNGKDIYDGDIVRGTTENEHQGQSAVFIDTWNIQPFSYLNCYDTKLFEVIGNIYENQELLNS